MPRPFREVGGAAEAPASKQRGGELSRAALASRQHGAIHILPHSGGQQLLGLAGAGAIVVRVAAADQALVVTHQPPYG